MKVAILVMMAVPMWAQLQLSALDGLAGKAKESTEITLDQATLQLANGFLGNAKGQDAKGAELLKKLKAIQVRAYEFRKAGDYDAGIVRSLQEQLRTQGWTKYLDFSDAEEGETFQLFSRTVNGRSAGFAMVAAEAKELTVIYIDGEISLAELSGLGGQFGIPKIPAVGQTKESGKNKKGKE